MFLGCSAHLLQMEQWNGFSPLCVLQWAVRLAACENDLLQL